MEISFLLEEFDLVDFDVHAVPGTSSTHESAVTLPEVKNDLKQEGNVPRVECIDSLLEELKSSSCNDSDSVSLTSENMLTSDQQKTESNHRTEEVYHDIEAVKKESISKFSASGYEIHKKLKESKVRSNELIGIPSSWKSKSTFGKSIQLATPVSVVTGKVDVYAEPTFGLRLVNPLVSSQFIQSNMIGKQPVAVENIAYHLRCGDKNADWVFAGAVVFKSGLKTSQKGSQYCLWKISDLKRDLRTVSVYLFSKACSDLWKVAIGTVVAILNATPFNKDEHISKDDLTLTVRSADQVMIWGGSRDYGICKAKKKNGENCTSFVNKSACEFCLYHVKSEYNKYSNRRSDLQFSSSGGSHGLRNKVLGKNEVFYGGKSFSALKPPSRENNVRKRDHKLLNMLPLKAATESATLGQSDSRTLELLSRERTEERDTLKKTVNVKTIASNTEKGFVNRLHLLKEAGQRMIENGETTRVTLVKPQKKCGISFATAFSSSEPVTPCAAELESRISRKRKSILQATTDEEKPSCSYFEKLPISLDFELHVEAAAPDSKRKHVEYAKDLPLPEKICGSSNIELKVESPNSSRTLKFSHEFNTSNVESTTSLKLLKNFRKDSLSNMSPNTNIKPEDTSLLTDKENFQKKTSPLVSIGLGNNRIGANCVNIHERKKTMNKIHAINLIKKQGGLSKNNPNRVKPDLEKKKSLNLEIKLKTEEENEVRKGKQVAKEKSVLSQRFIDLMNARSKHEDLADVAEAIEQQNYFNKLEKKEQLEEKMLSTYKVPCKAVTCLKCKYKWFSASDLCRAEGHPIKVVDTFKRFFKCENCSNRTVSLEIIPLTNCKNCNSGKWSRTGMIRDKLVKSDHQLSIRGDEQKQLNSLSGTVNLNLLVPD